MPRLTFAAAVYHVTPWDLPRSRAQPARVALLGLPAVALVLRRLRALGVARRARLGGVKAHRRGQHAY